MLYTYFKCRSILISFLIMAGRDGHIKDDELNNLLILVLGCIYRVSIKTLLKNIRVLFWNTQVTAYEVISVIFLSDVSNLWKSDMASGKKIFEYNPAVKHLKNPFMAGDAMYKSTFSHFHSLSVTLFLFLALSLLFSLTFSSKILYWQDCYTYMVPMNGF